MRLEHIPYSPQKDTFYHAIQPPVSQDGCYSTCSLHPLLLTTPFPHSVYWQESSILALLDLHPPPHLTVEWQGSFSAAHAQPPKCRHSISGELYQSGWKRVCWIRRVGVMTGLGWCSMREEMDWGTCVSSWWQRHLCKSLCGVRWEEEGNDLSRWLHDRRIYLSGDGLTDENFIIIGVIATSEPHHLSKPFHLVLTVL